MANSSGPTSELAQKLAFLEQEVRLRDAEIARYRAALAKSNAELEQIINDLGHELKMAAQIQKVLSPTEIPTIPGCEFSTKFVSGTDRGGDYFDVFEHEDKMRFGIVMACSSGYSMSALFLSVLIKLSSQIEARKGIPADQVLTRMATELIPNIDNADTASIFYAVVDRRNFTLSYSSNGSLLGFLQVVESDNITRLLPVTGPFRKDFAEKPLAATLQLNGNERLVLCSEGLLSAADKHGECFGAERIIECMHRAKGGTVHDLRNDLLFQAEQFVGTSEPARDQTVIVMEVKDRVIKLAKPIG